MSTETEREPLPTAWPETVRQAMQAIQSPKADVDGRWQRDNKAAHRHLARVSALQNALHLSIATHGMVGRR